MFRFYANFLKKPLYLRELNTADRGRTQALFFSLNWLFILCVCLLIFSMIFLSSELIANIVLIGFLLINMLCLILLHSGNYKFAGNLLNSTVFVVLIVTIFLDVITTAPIRGFSQIGLIIASIALAGLFGSKRLPIVLGALYIIALGIFTIYLYSHANNSLDQEVILDFAGDGMIAIFGGSILIFILRRIYDRSLLAVNIRGSRLELLIKKLKQNETRFHLLSDASFEAVVLTENGRIIEANRAFSDIFGFALTKNNYIQLQDIVRLSDHKKLDSFLAEDNHQSIELNCSRSDGSSLLVELRSSIASNNDTTQRSIVIRDITQERADRNQLEYLAYYDPLTGLANRKLLQERLNQLISNHRDCALILADIDHFKEINDTLGHSFGDSLLQAVGRRLKTAFNEDLLIGRAGGDEFILLVPDITTERMIRNIATAFHAEIVRPVTTEGITIELQCSIGVAYTPIHGLDFNSLLRCADVAMYTSKQTGVEIAIYASILDRHTPRRLQLLSDISRMIREKSFSLHFQPKVELLNSEIQGYEVLSRWQHKQLGAISPSEIIPLAETGNQIHTLTETVIQATFDQLRQWKATNFDPVIAVNVSARNLTDETFVPFVIDSMNRYDILPSQLEFEITESAFMFDPKRALQSVQKIKEIGIRLSVDDFGTGYSSLSYLTDLPVDSLKIDLSFVRKMHQKQKYKMLVSSTIQLGHGLGLSVIAEGIENQETADLLRQMGCDQGQGFYFGKPVPAAAILR